MPDLAVAESKPVMRPLAPYLKASLKRLYAGNPSYLASAGLLLYGINQLTNDPKLVGAEPSLLRFNFCALVIYEIMLVITAIALARRRIWYDALLLVGLANAFVIVPFSLISRAVYLSPHLALAMCISGTLLAVLKFWAFKKYIPDLSLSRRLLVLGSLLLLANAAAPLRFKAMAGNPEQIARWLDVFWLIALPTFAALAVWLPRGSDPGALPGKRRWLPLAFYLGWILVTSCHVAGIGFWSGFDWRLPLVVPTVWVASWIVYLRLADLGVQSNRRLRQGLLFIPVCIPLLAGDAFRVLPILGLLNLGCYGVRFLLKDRSRAALVQLLSAIAVLLAGMPMAWLTHFAPGMLRPEWIVACLFLCFFWLIFLSRDPRVAFSVAIALVLVCALCGSPVLTVYAGQIGLVSLLVHSFRWDDRTHRGAAALRNVASLLWFLFSSTWLKESAHEARLLVYSEALVLSVCYGLHTILHGSWKPRVAPLAAGAVLAAEPVSTIVGELTAASPGFLAIAGSFVLFALGSVAAFAKSRGQGLQATAPIRREPAAPL
jgi:hypothetical protein